MQNNQDKIYQCSPRKSGYKLANNRHRRKGLNSTSTAFEMRKT